MRQKRCPPLRFKCDRDDASVDGFICQAFNANDGQEVGRIIVGRAGAEDGTSLIEGIMQVSFVTVFAQRPGEQRCGVGTRLYERAAAEACSKGLRLASDTTRTRFAEGFWKKQVEKGRAECLPHKRGTPRGGSQVDDRFTPTGRRWRCKRYALKSCPPVIDLSGTSKRIDWRTEPLVKRKRR